jgi:RNA polymerase sigma-70 factor (ECF subfamily)
MDPSRSDALLRRARHGDPDAANELFERHVGPLRLYVRHRLGRALAARVEVDDIVQETLLRALQDLQRDSHIGEHAFSRTLCMIARHVLADAARAVRRLKRDGRHVRLDRSGWTRAGLAESALAGSTAGPFTRVALAEGMGVVEQAWLELPPHYRRVIVLRQLEQRPAREVAELIRSTEQAVHALYRRALTAWAMAADVR